MKKSSLLLICVIILVCCVGCKPGEPIILLEYDGVPLSSLSYQTIDYMGGYTRSYLLDFDSNTVTKTEFYPYFEDGQQETSRVISEFTDEEEREFINKIYSYGLFRINERYENTHVNDGGGWTLQINYSDGSTKKSTGSNDAPSLVFNNCAIPFYELCGERVMGNIPTTYFAPPIIDFSVSYTYNNHFFSGNNFVDFSRGNYLWNGHEVSGVDLYEVAMSGRASQLLSRGKYELELYTANYDNYNGKYEKFDKCVVMSYALDSQLSDGKEVLSTGWFKSVDIPYEPDRIYVITLKFKDGDFVEYVFSTATLDQKINYGIYHYNIYSKGKSVLDIKADGSFCLDPFDYLNESDRGQGEASESLVGSWAFEIIDGTEYLVLTADSGERLVLDYCAQALFVDFENSTLDLGKYNLEGDSESTNQNVRFSITRY